MPKSCNLKTEGAPKSDSCSTTYELFTANDFRGISAKQTPHPASRPARLCSRGGGLRHSRYPLRAARGSVAARCPSCRQISWKDFLTKFWPLQRPPKARRHHLSSLMGTWRQARLRRQSRNSGRRSTQSPSGRAWIRRNFTLLPRVKNAFEDKKSFEWPTNLFVEGLPN